MKILETFALTIAMAIPTVASAGAGMPVCSMDVASQVFDRLEPVTTFAINSPDYDADADADLAAIMGACQEVGEVKLTGPVNVFDIHVADGDTVLGLETDDGQVVMGFNIAAF